MNELGIKSIHLWKNDGSQLNFQGSVLPSDSTSSTSPPPPVIIKLNGRSYILSSGPTTSSHMAERGQNRHPPTGKEINYRVIRRGSTTTRVTPYERPPATEKRSAVDGGDESEEIKECPICFEDYSENRKTVTLPCSHEFCEKCNEYMFRNKYQIVIGVNGQRQRQIDCPTCRGQCTEFTNPAGTVVSGWNLVMGITY